jgi:hypothetical protein
MTRQEALPIMDAGRDDCLVHDMWGEGVMHLGVVHTIRDRAAWDSVKNVESVEFPPGFVLLGSATEADVSRAICIWDAPSVDALQRMLDEMLEAAAVNDCFVADQARSVLPAPQTAPTSTRA